MKLTPDSILKFDTRVQVSVKGCKNLELRMGGTVEPPCVDIDLVRKETKDQSCALYETYVEL